MASTRTAQPGSEDGSIGRCSECGEPAHLHRTGPAVPNLCPKCQGQGHVNKPPWVAGDQPSWSATTAGTTYECPVCKGEGVLWQ